MRRRCLMITITVLLLSVPEIAPADGSAVLDAAHRKACDQVVAAWLGADDAGLREGLSRVAQYEVFLLAEDRITTANAMISRVPSVVAGGSPRQIGAYLWFYRLQKTGLDLSPAGLFAGKTFTYFQGDEQ